MKKALLAMTAAFLLTGAPGLGFDGPPYGRQSQQRTAQQQAGKRDGTGPIHTPGTGGGTGAGRRAGRK